MFREYVEVTERILVSLKYIPERFKILSHKNLLKTLGSISLQILKFKYSNTEYISRNIYLKKGILPLFYFFPNNLAEIGCYDFPQKYPLFITICRTLAVPDKTES